MVALRTTAGHCQQSIEEFWQKVKKYQPHLGEDRGGWKVNTAWMKVRWALCEKNDVKEFRENLMAHTLTIQGLLHVIEMFEFFRIYWYICSC